MVARSGASALAAGGQAAPAGEKGQEGDGKAPANQVDSAEGAGDKAGEPTRTAYQLDEDQRNNLGELRKRAEREPAGAEEREQAFWSQIAPPMGFNPVTVQPAEDVLESGTFTAWPREEASPEAGDFDTSTMAADQEAALGRMEEIAEGADLRVESLAGDLRDCMLDIFRTRARPWPALSPIEQRDTATAIDFAIKVVLRKAVKLIAADDRTTVAAQLGQYTDKGGGEITGTLKLVGVTDNNILALHRAAGKPVLIVVADEGPYLGQRGDVAIDPDDPELRFEAGNDDEAGRAGDGELGAEERGEDEVEAEAVDEGEAQYQAAVAAVREHDKASISWLQRNLQIGHTIATALIERMEREGVVSPPEGDAGKRRVLPVPPGDSEESGDRPEGAASADAKSA
jgi:hypothetical protein